MTNQRKRIEQIERGQEASLIEATIGLFINEQITVKVQRMVAHYRSGNAKPDYLLGQTAEISALMELISTLEAHQRQAIIATEKEYGEARKEA